MSVQAMTRVMDSSEAGGVARLVLLVMANRAGGDFEECFASVERLAFECRVDARTVQRAIARLVESGDLLPAGTHPKHRTNVYRVMPVARVAESHPPGASATPAPPERKELGVTGSLSSSSPTGQRSPQGATRRFSEAEFEKFWAEYPLRKGKAAAKRKFGKALGAAGSLDVLIAGARRYVNDPNRDPKKTKYAEGWLGDERWNDEDTHDDDPALRLLRERRQA